MHIRLATIHDLDCISQIEHACFPPAEAATKDAFYDRLSVYPDHFWLLELDATVIGFIDGMVTNETAISDAMFEHAKLHNKEGAWQAIFGVTILPEYRNKGYAALIMHRVIADAKSQQRKGCILTAKSTMVGYYEKFGFKSHGISNSVHGGEIWYDMRLEF